MEARIYSGQTSLTLLIRGFALIFCIGVFHQLGRTQAPSNSTDYIIHTQLPSSAQSFLLASGQRFRKPGREIIAATAALSRDDKPPTPIQIVWEFPGKIRIDGSRGTTTFDRNSQNQSTPVDRDVQVELETLLEDSLEGFLANLRSGSSRFVGAGYRVKGTPLNGPVYDIYQVWSRSKARGSQTSEVKHYWFNSRTKLLSRVLYKLPSLGGNELVEVIVSDWRVVNGESIPFSVERREGGRSAIKVQLATVNILPRSGGGR
jgi:hypothetical protein